MTFSQFYHQRPSTGVNVSKTFATYCVRFRGGGVASVNTERSFPTPYVPHPPQPCTTQPPCTIPPLLLNNSKPPATLTKRLQRFVYVFIPGACGKCQLVIDRREFMFPDVGEERLCRRQLRGLGYIRPRRQPSGHSPKQVAT